MKTKRIPSLCGAMLPLFLGTGDLYAQESHKEKPNILWLTFEDTSWYELGCYGNEHVQTPHIDSLASHGIQFMNAWSVAPQSSPARSSLITGCYATTYGMDIHPRPVETPCAIFFPELLREHGYYCTNNSKTHYNTTLDNTLFWDECSDTASYNSDKRGDNQPFFSVFNTVTSHMGRVRTFHLDGRRDYTREGLFPAQLPLPPHVPDTYEVRSDYAAHLEAIQDVDEWVGLFISDLKEKDLLENTLIFIFSDNGGCLPRGKGYLYETGLKVPLIIHIPQKWQHLISEAPGTKIHAPVSFIDLAPTVLSLVGINPPEQMQGKTIVGKQATNRERDIQFAFGSNQLHHFMPVRAATNGRYKYIRSYVPYKQFALRNYYQWGMPSNKSWDKLVLEKQMANPTWLQPYSLHPTEMLFDTETDPFELNNLAENPHYAAVLVEFREAVSQHIRETGDLGFFIPSSREGVNLYEEVRKMNYPLEQLYAMAELVGTAGEDDMPLLINALRSDDPNMRYWATVACAQSAVTGSLSHAPRELIQLIKDPDPYVACEAAYAAIYLNETDEGIRRLLFPVREEERRIGYSLLESLSMNPAMHPLIREHADELVDKANSLPAIENEDCGFMAKGILANIGLIGVDDIYGEESYEQGLKLNRGRRPKKPTP
jgi:N-sulfoglucosamine sulfohydrolase